MLTNFETIELREAGVHPQQFSNWKCWYTLAFDVGTLGLCTGQMTDDGTVFEIALINWNFLSTQHGPLMELVKSRPLLVNLILHVRCVIQVQIDTSRIFIQDLV